MRFTYTVDIRAPIERAFSCVEEPEKLKAWMKGLEEMVYLDGYDPARPVGARFRQKVVDHGCTMEYEGEVVAYKKPEHLAVRLFDKKFTIRVDYHFRPEGDGTRLDYVADFSTKSWTMKVMGWLFGWLTRRIVRRHMANLKALAEQPPPGLSKAG